MAFKGNRFALLEGVAEEVEDLIHHFTVVPSSVAENRKGIGKKPPRSFDDGTLMYKHERIEATQLPEVMIQHIQSFLDAKEAAQTTVLSKSWYDAWLSRPNLDFVHECISYRLENAFVEYVEKTLQRYDKKELKIQRFKLLTYGYCSDDQISRAVEWTKEAMKLSATDIDVEFRNYYRYRFILPREVLESKSLVTLSLYKVTINLEDHKLCCPRLKSLRLCEVFIKGDSIWDMIWMCPLIEELELSLCYSSYDISTNDSCRGLLLKPGLSVNGFHKLKVLSLMSVNIGEWFFRDLSTKFTFLKELTLDGSNGYEEIQICSNSLECIVFCDWSEESRVLRIKLDVPRIRKFELQSSYVPSLSFKTTSTGWDSYIEFDCTVYSSWFENFRRFLLELSSSKIYLDFLIYFEEAYEYANHMVSLPKPPIVERLVLHEVAPLSFLEKLFWSCRPKFIRLSFYGHKHDIVKFICKLLIKEEYEIRSASGLHDLEEVNVEILGETAWTWRRPLPTKTIYESVASNGVWANTDVCLQLQWG